MDTTCGHLQEQYGVAFKEHEVQKVMDKDLNMGYRAINEIAPHANSEKNLVLRQRFAVEFLRLAATGAVFICIDETWLNQTDFRRRSWQVRGQRRSLPKA